MVSLTLPPSRQVLPVLEPAMRVPWGMTLTTYILSRATHSISKGVSPAKVRSVKLV